MSPRRREFVRFLSVSTVAAATLACWAGVALAAGLWECNWCHQQYQGNQPPAFAKCPAKEMKQNHWWIKKG
jgi:hypothetical protein